MTDIIEATTIELISDAKALFKEYAASLDFDLCFQDFDRELAEFPKDYTAPRGGLYVARVADRTVGCVGFRFFEQEICEMKRLYVQPDARGHQAGLKLAQKAIEAARIMGYRRMRLDTLSSMAAANRLYHSLGFVEITPYRSNPIEGARYLELDLTTTKP